MAVSMEKHVEHRRRRMGGCVSLSVAMAQTMAGDAGTTEAPLPARYGTPSQRTWAAEGELGSELWSLPYH